jgi:hypothetical protein
MVPEENMMGHNGKTFLHLLQWGKSLKIFEKRDHLAKTVQIYLQGDLMQNHVVKVMVPEHLGPQ